MTGTADPQALAQLAASHKSAGRWQDAIAAYQQLLALRPDLANTWFNLALLLRRVGAYDAALEAYRQALVRGVDGPEEVHLNRGVIFAEDLNQPTAAAHELGLALALRPDYTPAWLNLGNLHEDTGDRPKAVAAYERLLTLEPNCHTALARLARLCAPDDDRAGRLIERLKAALVGTDVTDADKADLSFALAQLLDTRGDYDAAFAAATAGNAFSRCSAGQAVYDRAHQAAQIDRIMAAYPRRTTDDCTRDDLRPLFICGMFRSGSTLVERILAAHPRVMAGGELDFFPALARSLATPPGPFLRRPEADERLAAATRYRALLSRLAPDGRRVTDKRPDNFLHIGLIKSILPGARFIHTTRHPLDNGLSVYFLHLDASMSYALDLADFGHHYAQYRRLMAHWKSLYGDDILDLNYDTLVREPAPAIAQLQAFCGLDKDDACLNFHDTTGNVRTASVWQVRQPLYQHASGRWRHYERQLAPLRQALLPEFGTELDV